MTCVTIPKCDAATGKEWADIGGSLVASRTVNRTTRTCWLVGMWVLGAGAMAASLVIAASPPPMPSAKQLASTKPAAPRPTARASGFV